MKEEEKFFEEADLVLRRNMKYVKNIPDKLDVLKYRREKLAIFFFKAQQEQQNPYFRVLKCFKYAPWLCFSKTILMRVVHMLLGKKRDF